MADLKALNEKLADFPYVAGYTPSQEDVSKLNAVDKSQADSFVHVKRWIKHMASFNEEERKKFPGVPSAGGDAKKESAPKKAQDDDDVDLFGSDDDEEADKARQERVKAYQEKKAAKPAVIAKSSILLDVKPWDDVTDVNDIEKLVRGINADGLVWGAAKKVPLAYGIHKLSIIAVVEDAKISVDWLTEQIENFEIVQSTDIAAFQKI